MCARAARVTSASSERIQRSISARSRAGRRPERHASLDGSKPSISA
jgi:hypothetical protein